MPLSLTIRGYLVGPIWQPGADCYKPLAYNITCDGTLRDHVLRATKDGDFQHCEIAHGVLLATVTRRNGSSTITHTRSFPLERFPSIADCLRRKCKEVMEWWESDE